MRFRFSTVVTALIALWIGCLAGPAPASAAKSHAVAADWSAGPVSLGTGYRRDGGSLRVREVQRTLRARDFGPGPVDGLFGPLTRRAVIRFQHAEKLAQDGIVGPRTLRRLRLPDGGRRARRRPGRDRRIARRC